MSACGLKNFFHQLVFENIYEKNLKNLHSGITYKRAYVLNFMLFLIFLILLTIFLKYNKIVSLTQKSSEMDLERI